MREIIARLNGTITVQRNASGEEAWGASGMSFFLRFPRSQGMVQGLLVRAANQDLIVPFSQVQRIDYGRQELYSSSYTLQELLGSGRESIYRTRSRFI
jgi:chemotaxis protein histidine kinase CheA